PAPPHTELYTLSLHDALPICIHHPEPGPERLPRGYGPMRVRQGPGYRRCGSATRPRGKDGRCMKPSSIVPGDHVIITRLERRGEDRKSTRLNSSHVKISYAVF